MSKATDFDEKRAQAYREWRAWAVRLIADNIIKHGFTELGGCIDMIVNSYCQLEKQ